MHELSLSYATVESVLESVASLNAARVISVTLVAGELSGVSIEAFRFSFPIAAAGTILEDTNLIIIGEPVRVFCSPCNQIGALASIQNFRCPVCGLPSGDIRSGEDFIIQSIEIETAEPVTAETVTGEVPQNEHAHR